MLDQPLPVVVRPSTEQDVPFMVDIYAYHVQNGLGDFQAEPLQPEDIKRRRKAMLKRRLPHIVADLGGVIVGYAYAVPFLKRPAYRYAVKHSIYVHKDHRQAGVGRKLLPALIEACAAAGYRQMVCYIDGNNAPFAQPARGLWLRARRRAEIGRLPLRPVDRHGAAAAPAWRRRRLAAGQARKRAGGAGAAKCAE